MPWPCSLEDAIQFGRVRLAEWNQPRAAATFRVRGWIRDRAGHWQPANRVKYGDRIVITNHPNHRVRLIHQTEYDDDTKTLQVAVDNTFQRLDAYVARQQGALAANGVRL